MKYFFSWVIHQSYVFYNHDQEWQLDSKSLFLICRTSYISSCYIGSHDLENWRLDILVGQSLDVSIMNWNKEREYLICPKSEEAYFRYYTKSKEIPTDKCSETYLILKLIDIYLKLININYLEHNYISINQIFLNHYDY